MKFHLSSGREGVISLGLFKGGRLDGSLSTLLPRIRDDAEQFDRVRLRTETGLLISFPGSALATTFWTTKKITAYRTQSNCLDERYSPSGRLQNITFSLLFQPGNSLCSSCALLGNHGGHDGCQHLQAEPHHVSFRALHCTALHCKHAGWGQETTSNASAGSV